MTESHYRLMIWTAGVIALATAAILYQHAQHSAYLVSMLGGAPPTPSGTTAPVGNPAFSIWAASAPSKPRAQPSTATGQYTPLGPNGSIFAVNPPQNW
jgi:hypothetical protein